MIDKLSLYFKNLSFYHYTIFLVIFGYFPVLFLGHFIQDDWGIISKYNFSIEYASKTMCGVNNNRPLSCLYFGLLTRLYPIFQVYFGFILMIYFFFIKNIFNIFDFLLKTEVTKKVFVTFLIFPFFSYTIFYSPAMQGIGVTSLLLWSFSLIFLKKFLAKNKKIYIAISYLFILLMFLLYESATPLLGINLFFPLIYKNRKIFLYNFISIILIMLFIYYLQKNIFPIIFDIDLSRIKLSIYDYKKILFLIIINLALTLNIIFYSFEIFFKSVLHNIVNFNLQIFIQYFLILLLVIINFKNFKFKGFSHFENKKNDLIIYGLMVAAVIFLTVLMHVLANTGLDFIKYNNRALTSYSFLLAFISLISLNYVNKKRINFVINTNLIVFLILMFNFLTFQNNLIKENFDQKKVINYIFTQEKNKIYTSKNEVVLVIVKYDFVRDLLSYNSLDYYYKLRKENQIYENYELIMLNEFKFCNKSYFEEYVKIAYLDRPEQYSFNVAYFNKYAEPLSDEEKVNANISQPYMQIENTKKIINDLEIYFKCNEKIQPKGLSNLINKKKFIDNRYDGIFLGIMKYIYNNLFS